jgi:hypothetical protein
MKLLVHQLVGDMVDAQENLKNALTRRGRVDT